MGGLTPAGMRPAWERRLIQVRVHLSADPEVALDAAGKLLRGAKYNSEKVRATLTRGWAHRAAGRPERLKEAIDRSSCYRRPGDLALSEITSSFAAYLVLAEDFDGALRYSEKGVALARPLAASTFPQPGNWRSNSFVESLVRRAAYSATLAVRAQARFHVHDKEALQDALEALKWADPAYVPHVHLAAVSATGIIMLGSEFATPELCVQVLRLADQAEKPLKRKRVKAKSRPRILLRVLRAYAFTLLGSIELAESTLTGAIRDLEALGLARDADLLVKQLALILSDRAAQVGRARLIADERGIPLSRARNLPGTDADDEPIGF